MNLLHLGLCLGILSAVSAEQSSKATFAKRVSEGDLLTPDKIVSRRLKEELQLDQHPNFRRRHVGLVTHPSDRRQNKQDFSKEENCDQALLTCLPEDNCADCFRFLYSEQVDWGRITPETSCEEVTSFLAEKGYCGDMHDDKSSKDAFCKSFNSCAVWEEDEIDEDEEPDFDCDSLTECDWDGMVKSFIGDGICQDSLGGCYNTAICNWDGGDCCEDTCSSRTYVDCGHDGFACRNPNSTSCDLLYTLACENNANIPDENNPDPADTKCNDDEVKYRLVMYDSFGDGWDQTAMTIAPTNKKGDIRFNGGLEKGSVGSRYICLPSESTCIHVDVNGGEWGNEVSWEIKPMTHGAPALGGGGAPMNCEFAVGGKACDNTCDGKANVAPNKDPEYKEFKEMYTCIEDKCTIQVGTCEKDDTCNLCLSEDKADFCYGSDAFLAVVDCTMCQCTERQDTEFCHQKLTPGLQPAGSLINGDGRQPDGSPRACSPGETMKGSNAVLTFAQCTDFDQVSMLVTDYDENKFGLLDQFETCAHSFAASDDHGGHTGLGCMQILVNAMNYANSDDSTEDENARAIASLAGLLYHNASSFCECAATASADCPLCSSFVHMKTLLYESLDACQSLDEIDCDAWVEFYKPCQKNINEKFGSVDFSNDETCTFVHDGCGGAGPFPAFRRLDCDEEGEGSISEAAWDFYKQYSGACLPPEEDTGDDKPSGGDVKPVAPVAPPTPRPTVRAPTAPKPAPTPATPRPTSKPYIPSGSSGSSSSSSFGSGGSSGSSSSSSSSNSIPYVPQGDSYDSSFQSSSSGGSSHRLRNFLIFCVLGGVGFVYYKRRSDAFSFVRYRNTRNYAGGESEMYSAPYSGLTMDSGSGAFQPPSLPPSGVDGGMM
jgi:uncharacterized membrane protein YgcG